MHQCMFIYEQKHCVDALVRHFHKNGKQQQ